MAAAKTPRSLIVALDRVTIGAGASLKVASPESLSASGLKQIERAQSVFDDGNVVGVGIAEKRSDGGSLGELGLVFYVKKKLPMSALTQASAIPSVVEGGGGKAVFTDVLEVGTIIPQAPNFGPPPLRCGFSISHRAGTAGTLGAFVRKASKTFALSNAHVLAQSGAAKIGDAILYPGALDGGAHPASAVGKLASFTKWSPGVAFLNVVDAALAEVADPHTASLISAIAKAKAPVRIADPAREMQVCIIGRTSGESRSIVRDINAKVLVDYPTVGIVGFHSQVACDLYTKGGDSGAIVVDEESGAVVGLHFAADDAQSYFTPIRAVMRALRFRF